MTTKSETPLFVLDDEVRWILGRPNFWCAPIAAKLRRLGHEIQERAEDEQAVVIHWMLGLYLEHGDKWPEVARRVLTETREEDGT